MNSKMKDNMLICSISTVIAGIIMMLLSKMFPIFSFKGWYWFGWWAGGMFQVWSLCKGRGEDVSKCDRCGKKIFFGTVIADDWICKDCLDKYVEECDNE